MSAPQTKPATESPARSDLVATPCSVLSACEFCGYEFDQEALGKYGCANCHGEGLDDREESQAVRHLDLFSGIGGFALAAQIVGGIETVGFCEIDPWAQRVLAKNFPQVPIHGDVKTLTGNEYGRIDLITGGYPCQPFSNAGKRNGASDDRHLWPEVRRIVKATRPRLCLFENVAGHISLGLDEVLSQMEGLGYSVRPIVVPACAVDACHRRDRVWIMAYAESERHWKGGEKGNFSEEDGRPNRKMLGKLGCSSKREGALGNSASCRWNEKQVASNSSKRKYKVANRGPSFKGGRVRWLPEPAVGRVVDGIPNRVDRLRGLGNAIVPQVAAEILATMMEVYFTQNVRAHPIRPTQRTFTTSITSPPPINHQLASAVGFVVLRLVIQDGSKSVKRGQKTTKLMDSSLVKTPNHQQK